MHLEIDQRIAGDGAVARGFNNSFFNRRSKLLRHRATENLVFKNKAAASGAIAGYPLVDFKVQLIDGSYHNVDSDEHSFRAAGRKAFRNAMEKVKPALLEPIMDVEIDAPQECSGDIMGDLNSRRGRVQGMDTRGKQQVVKAQVPMAEMLNYQSTLNSITAARGSFHMQFSHYDPVPSQIAQKIIQQAKDEGRIRVAEED